MWVMAQLFGDETAAVKNGDRVTIETDAGGATIQGQVSNVGAVVDADTRSVTARVVVDNADGALKRQMYVRAKIQRSEEHTSELQSLMRISYAVFCLQKKKRPENT